MTKANSKQVPALFCVVPAAFEVGAFPRDLGVFSRFAETRNELICFAKVGQMPLQGKTVLAVDDCEEHNYAISRVLEHAGAVVLRAYTGNEALNLASHHPDAVLLDVNLPDVNGFEVCRRLKGNPATADIPIIFLTATFQSTNARAMA